MILRESSADDSESEAEPEVEELLDALELEPEPELGSELDPLLPVADDEAAELCEADEPVAPVAAASISEAVSHAVNNKAPAANNKNLFIVFPHLLLGINLNNLIIIAYC